MAASVNAASNWRLESWLEYVKHANKVRYEGVCKVEESEEVVVSAVVSGYWILDGGRPLIIRIPADLCWAPFLR
jgi:hypothetical protein